MALIKCPECRKEISDQSSNCVHCGFPLIDKKQDYDIKQTTNFNENLDFKPAAVRDKDNNRENVISNLKKALNAIERLNLKDEEIKNAKSELEEMKRTVKSIRGEILILFTKFILWLVILLYVFDPVIEMLYESMGWEFLHSSKSFPFFTAAIIDWIIVSLLLKSWKHKREEKANNYQQTNEPIILKKIDTLTQEMKILVESEETKHMMSVVPSDYATVDACVFFISMLNNFRADTLKEAINLYEEEKYKRQMIELQQQEIELVAESVEIGKQTLENQQKLIDTNKKISRQVRFGNAMSVINTVRHWKN